MCVAYGVCATLCKAEPSRQESNGAGPGLGSDTGLTFARHQGAFCRGDGHIFCLAQVGAYVMPRTYSISNLQIFKNRLGLGPHNMTECSQAWWQKLVIPAL